METATLTKQQALVKEIHGAFDKAASELFAEPVKPVMPDKTALKKKAEHLKKLGFKNSEAVKQVESFDSDQADQLEHYEERKATFELAQKYREKYPFLKFITEKQLDGICKKYNLIYCPVENYTGDVPDKNLEEIANSQQIDDDDREENSYILTIKSVNSFDAGTWRGVLSKREYMIHCRSEYDLMVFAYRMGFNSPALAKKSIAIIDNRVGGK
jgi:hypothetical protein